MGETVSCNWDLRLSNIISFECESYGNSFGPFYWMVSAQFFVKLNYKAGLIFTKQKNWSILFYWCLNCYWDSFKILQWKFLKFTVVFETWHIFSLQSVRVSSRRMYNTYKASFTCFQRVYCCISLSKVFQQLKWSSST